MTAQQFYADVLSHVTKSKIPFMIGGTYAFMEYTGIVRETKDLDLFCKAGDYPRILNLLKEKGFKTEVEDERWLAKAHYDGYYVDVIFSSRHGLLPVDDTWFAKAPTSTLFGSKVKLIPPEELIWSKSFIKGRYRADDVDIYHLFLKTGNRLNWKRLLMRMEQQWEVLFSQILMFRFIYPSERNLIPKEIMKEFIARVTNQLDIPPSTEKICRGSMFTRTYYEVDYKDWGYKDIR